MKVYLAHSISTKGEFEDSKRVGKLIGELGYNYYAAANNNRINDKSNDPTPKDIYNGDVSEIISSDIFVVNLSGGLQDGTISEIGIVAGMNIMKKVLQPVLKIKLVQKLLKKAGISPEITPIIAYTTNARLLQPQYYKGISSAGANHLVLGIVDVWGEFVGTEENMLKKLKELTKTSQE